MRKLIYMMNVTLDGYIAAPGDDLGWGTPSVAAPPVVQRPGPRARCLPLRPQAVGADERALADRRPAAGRDARGGRVRPHLAGDAEGGVLLDLDEVSGRNARLVTGDAVAEISRLKAEDGPPMEIGGAGLAGAAMRAGLIDDYQLVTHPVLVGDGTPFFSALDSWVNLRLVETRLFPDGVTLAHYETRR